MQIMRDNDDWIKQPFAVRPGTPFETFREVLEYQLTAQGLNNAPNDGAAILDSSAPSEFMEINTADTSLGGNDAINPYWQFNEDDDIVHPLTSTDGRGVEGMGRVYSEMYDKTQQILWLAFGVPEYTNLKDFYTQSIDGDISRMMNNGLGTEGVTKKIGKLIGSTIGTIAFFIPNLIFDTMSLIRKLAATEFAITKYYDLNLQMPLYFRLANSIMAHLAVNMGLYNNGVATEGGGPQNEVFLSDQFGSSGLPRVLQENGLDIFKILTKRIRRLNQTAGLPFTDIDDLVENAQNRENPDDASLKQKYWNNLVGAGLGGIDFIGFRVEKSTDSSESISNQSGESSVAGMLNNNAKEFAEKKFSFMGGNTGVGVIDAAAEGIKGMVDSILGSMGADGLGATIMGAGYFDIPEIWKDSSFTKNYSLNLALRSPYGDPVSIFQSIYVPLSLILAGCLPRSIGNNSYTSPFLLRAYCKGMFSIPLGLMESVSIRRGSSEHGWTYNQLPTAVDISISIKDLSPAMFLSIADGHEFLKIFTSNTVMQEYLATLSGMGLKERVYRLQQIKRKFQTSLKILRDTKLNPDYWGVKIGSSTIPKILCAVSPYSMLENNK